MGSVARSPEVSDLLPADRARELAALARARAEQARWGVYLTAGELELAAAAVEALPKQSVESSVLVQRFRERARVARAVIEGDTTTNGGRR